MFGGLGKGSAGTGEGGGVRGFWCRVEWSSGDIYRCGGFRKFADSGGDRKRPAEDESHIR